MLLIYSQMKVSRPMNIMEQLEVYGNEALAFVNRQDEITLIAAAAITLFAFFILLLFWRLRRSKRKRAAQAEGASAQPAASTSTPDEATATVSSAQVDEARASWLGRLQLGLSKTRLHFSSSISELLSKSKSFDEQTQENLHEMLFRADLGVATADVLMEHLSQTFRRDEAPSWPQLRDALVEKVKMILQTGQKPIVRPASGPQVILVVGVNGVGKTTSIGKLAAQYMGEGRSVLMCAADTYRAAAIEQLEMWSKRIGCDIIKHQAGADPASVAYDGVKAAIARKIDVLLIDTAGRLHSKKELMDELAKIKRVIGKDLPEAPHETWLAIDATTGQNAFMQVEAFTEVVQLSGLVVTKLDGTAKGGVVIGVSEKFQLPIRYIGVGEKAEDLRAFNANEFAESVF